MATAAIVLALVAVGYVLLKPGGPDYEVHARFQNASQLVKGNLVQVAGAPVGKITNIDLTRDGQAEVTMKLTDRDYVPLRRGTKAIVRQASLSGVANRYVDLQLPDGTQTRRSTTAASSTRPTPRRPSTSTSSSTRSTTRRARR